MTFKPLNKVNFSLWDRDNHRPLNPILPCVNWLIAQAEEA